MGKFINIDGLDGAGKSTLILRIKSFIESKGEEVVVVREPGGTEFGGEVRKLLLDERFNPCDYSELMLMYASRAQLIKEVIEPALDRGCFIISDRFVASTLAYQGFGRGLSLDLIRTLNQEIVRTCMPDLNLILDISPEVSLERARRSGKLDRIEQSGLEFYHRVRDGFLSLSDDLDCKILNASLDRDSVYRDAIEVIERDFF